MPTPAQISSEMKWEHIDWLVVNEGEVQQLPTSSSASQTETWHFINVPDSCLCSSALILQLASQPLFENVNTCMYVWAIGGACLLAFHHKGWRVRHNTQTWSTSACYGYTIYIPYITYPIVPTQNLCYRVSITLLISYPFISCFIIKLKNTFSIY